MNGFENGFFCCARNRPPCTLLIKEDQRVLWSCHLFDSWLCLPWNINFYNVRTILLRKTIDQLMLSLVLRCIAFVNWCLGRSRISSNSFNSSINLSSDHIDKVLTILLDNALSLLRQNLPVLLVLSFFLVLPLCLVVMCVVLICLLLRFVAYCLDVRRI